MRKCKLGEIAKFKTGPFGTQFKAAEYTQSGYPVINVKNIGIGRIIDNDIEFVSEKTRNRLSEHIIHEGDIVFARKGSVERHTYVRKEHDGWVQGSDCIKAKIDAGIEPRYVSYYLCLESVKKQLMLKAVGSTMPSMNTDILKDIAITLPDDEGVEKRIADFFDNINEKILSNEKIIATLESMAKTLYDYWFVQFDFPDANGRPYKTSGGKMEWNETLSREIPVGWEVKKLGDICETRLGGTPDTNNGDYWEGDIPWLNSGEVAISPILSSEKKITDLGRDSSATSTAEPGDVLMSITRYIRPSILGISACYNQSVVAVLQNERYKTSFIYPFLLSQVERYMGLRIGAQQPHINKKIVDATLVINPSKSILDKYYVKVDKVYRQIINIAKENKKLIELRDFILPILMNGQVTFRQ